jgi:hypothetical protein
MMNGILVLLIGLSAGLLAYGAGRLLWPRHDRGDLLFALGLGGTAAMLLALVGKNLGQAAGEMISLSMIAVGVCSLLTINLALTWHCRR